jgi:hypothetical protein
MAADLSTLGFSLLRSLGRTGTFLAAALLGAILAAFLEVYVIGHKTVYHSEYHDFRNNAVVYAVLGVLGSASFLLGHLLGSIGGRGHSSVFLVAAVGLMYSFAPLALSMLASHEQRSSPGITAVEATLLSYVLLAPLAIAWRLARSSLGDEGARWTAGGIVLERPGMPRTQALARVLSCARGVGNVTRKGG